MLKHRWTDGADCAHHLARWSLMFNKHFITLAMVFKNILVWILFM